MEQCFKPTAEFKQLMIRAMRAENNVLKRRQREMQNLNQIYFIFTHICTANEIEFKSQLTDHRQPIYGAQRGYI
jgi:hypothetical protein